MSPARADTTTHVPFDPRTMTAADYGNLPSDDHVNWEAIKDLTEHPAETPQRVVIAGSGGNKMNAKETALCGSRPAQCVGYGLVSLEALNYTDEKAHMWSADSYEERDDKSQALRHQYWFARLVNMLGPGDAWEWAWAHEGDDPISPEEWIREDSSCDIGNNEAGHAIFNQTPVGRDHIARVKATVEDHIRTGDYGRRKVHKPR